MKILLVLKRIILKVISLVEILIYILIIIFETLILVF